MVLSEADFRESTADKIDSAQGNSHLERNPQWILAGDRLLQRLIGPLCIGERVDHCCSPSVASSVVEIVKLAVKIFRRFSQSINSNKGARLRVQG